MLKTLSLILSVLTLSYVFYIAQKPVSDNPITIDKTPKTLPIHFLEQHKQGYIEKQGHFTFVPEKTAFVMIDLWENDVFSDYVQERINPTIQLLRNQGVLIIHARSQRPLSHLIDRQPSDIEVKYYDEMDDILAWYHIETLIYAGFNTMYCVIDKPNGILNIKSRQPNLNYFIVPELLASNNSLVKQISITLLKRQRIKVVTLKTLFQGFGTTALADYQPLIFTRKLIHIPSQKSYPMAIDTTVALAFDSLLLNAKQQAEVQQTILAYQQKGVIVFRYANEKIWRNKKEVLVDDFFQFLQQNKIQDMLFFGGHLNDKMIASKVGISRFYMNSRYLAKKSPNIWLLTDKLYVLNPQDKERLTWLNFYRKPNQFNGLKGRPTITHQAALKLLQFRK